MQIILNARERNTKQIPKGKLMNTKRKRVLDSTLPRNNSNVVVRATSEIHVRCPNPSTVLLTFLMIPYIQLRTA